MAFDQPGCRQCGEALASGANFCPACGLARQSPLLDPLGVGASAPVAAAPGAAGAERLRVLFGLGVVVVAVALVWAVLTAGGSETDGSEDASGADEGLPDDVGSSTSAPTTTTASTTASTTTSAALPGSTEPVGPMVGYANGVAGPVLGPDVAGVIVAVGEKVLSRLDLATGVVESIDLEWYVDQSWGFSVVADGKLMTTSTGGHLVLTDLRTGEQGERIELDLSANGFAQIAMLGPAGSDSVWLTTYGSSGDAPNVIEVDFNGATLQEVQLGPLFSPIAAFGRVLYLYGPGSEWRYDTVTETVEQSGLVGLGSVSLTSAGAAVVVSCQARMVCEAHVDTPSGLEPIPSLSAVDLGGPIQISPDGRSALVTDRGLVSDVGFDDYPLLTRVDLASGRRTDLGHPPIELYLGAVWLNDGAWIIGRGGDSQARLVAVDVGSGEPVLIDLPDGAEAFAGEPYETMLLFQPAA